jgi:hypothetical protein
VKQGGDDDAMTRVDKALEYAEEHCYDLLGRLASVQQEIRAVRNSLGIERGGGDDGNAKEAVRRGGEGQENQA